ncbi:MAG: hypothetical protein Q8K58_00895 [Acidimicrobiales bacterium]|nr:hypothetical protein [Acidimicrobiales bacterium]
MTGLRGLDRAPADRRLARVRAAVAGWSVLWIAVRFPHLLGLADLADRRWYPVGILAPLDGPPACAAVLAVLLLAIGSGIAAAWGWHPALSLPVWAAALLLVATYASSWGQLFHTENLLVLHALLLAGFAVAHRTRHIDPRTVLTALAVVVAAAYVVAAVAKLRGSGWDWLDGDILRNKVAFDNVRKSVIGAPASPFAGTVVGWGWLWAPLAVLTIAVELGAPIALLGRRWATSWIAAAWAFHVGILAIMAIGFPYQLLGLAYAPLLPLERLRVPWRVASTERCAMA